MTLHEILTIYLYAGCYLTNFWEIGVTVSFLHGVSDIVGGASKAFSETIYSNVTAFLFIIHLFIWFYFRLIVFPWIAWEASTQDIDMGHWLILPFFGYGLFCLVFMHAYWFHLFIQILYHYTRTGESEDTVEQGLADNNDNKTIPLD